MGCCLSGADDTNDTIVITRRIGVHHHKHQNRANHAQGVPTMFTIFKPVRYDHMEWIAPDVFRKFKGNMVFNTVFKRLFRIP